MNVDSALKGLLSINTNPSSYLNTALGSFTTATKIAMEFDQRLRDRQERLQKELQQLQQNEFNIYTQQASFDNQLQKMYISDSLARSRAKLNSSLAMSRIAYQNKLSLDRMAYQHKLSLERQNNALLNQEKLIKFKKSQGLYDKKVTKTSSIKNNNYNSITNKLIDLRNIK